MPFIIILKNVYCDSTPHPLVHSAPRLECPLCFCVRIDPGTFSLKCEYVYIGNGIIIALIPRLIYKTILYDDCLG